MSDGGGPGVPRTRAATLARMKRAAVKRAIREGELGFDEAIGDPENRIFRVEELLEQVPGFGPVRVSAVMRAAGVNPWEMVGALGAARRRLLLEAYGSETKIDVTKDGRSLRWRRKGEDSDDR